MANGLTHDSSQRQREDDPPMESGDDIDACVRDAGDLAPLCDEQEFTALLEGMIAEEAPRLFAVVQEYGDHADGRIAAWGMAFTDHASVVSVEYDRQMSLPVPEKALHHFEFGNHIRARLMWFGREADAPAPG